MKKYRCLACGRDKFDRPSPHRCGRNFRKRKLQFEEFEYKQNNMKTVEEKDGKIFIDGVEYAPVKEVLTDFDDIMGVVNPIWMRDKWGIVKKDTDKLSYTGFVPTKADAEQMTALGKLKVLMAYYNGLETRYTCVYVYHPSYKGITYINTDIDNIKLFPIHFYSKEHAELVLKHYKDILEKFYI